MKTFTFTKSGRALVLALVVVMGAVCVLGCGGGGSGSFTDKRDGKKYKTVKIGEQRWMATNLNFAAENSWCYENSEDNCTRYGRMYNYETAKTVCPDGWKLPDTADWRRLVTAAVGQSVAGRKLKSKSDWSENGNGTDELGFSALPGGWKEGSTFLSVGKSGFWWTATKRGFDGAYLREMKYDDEYVREEWLATYIGISVRCIADN
jgi:uncharacterized protein (TIGR02145 family)